MGRSHVAVAAAGWAVLAPPAAAALGHQLDPVGLVASLAVAAGAGVGPDIDHPQATIAHTHGAASKVVAEFVEEIAGGHRGATHWLATGAALGIVLTAVDLVWPRWTLAVALGLCGAWALRCSLPRRMEWSHRVFWAPVGAAAVGAGAYAVAASAWWVPAAVAWGWCVHPLCDAVTSERLPGHGVPLFGPFDRRRVAFGLIPPARHDEHGRMVTSPAERLVTAGCSALAIVATCWTVTA